MKYVPPVGGAPGDPYVDGDPGTGVDGSPVPAAAIEHPMREIEAIITAAGLTPSESNLAQLLAALRSAGVFQTAASNDATTKAATTAFVNPGSVQAVDGYVKLPSGLIIQWGLSGSCASGANLTVTLPIAFTTTNFCVVTTFAQSTDIGVGNVYIGQVRTLSAASFAVRNLGPASAQFHYIAIGK